MCVSLDFKAKKVKVLQFNNFPSFWRRGVIRNLSDDGVVDFIISPYIYSNEWKSPVQQKKSEVDQIIPQE